MRSYHHFVGAIVSQLSSTELSHLKAEFEAELAALQTEQGLWDDLTTWYILARKPKNKVFRSDV